MSWSRFMFILIAVVAAAPFAHTSAQGGKGAARDPGDAKTDVPPVRYESAFARYRPNADVDVGGWRDTNDHVGRIGGWRVYGREAIAGPNTDRQPAASGPNGSNAAVKPEHGHPHRGPR